MNTNFFFLKLFGHLWDIPPKSRDIPPKKFGFPGFEGHTELLAPTPSRGRPPPHPRISGPKSLGLGSFFLPAKQCPTDGVWRIGRGVSPDKVRRHGLPPQRAPLDTVYPLREHQNNVQRILWGFVSRHGLLDTVKKHMAIESDYCLHPLNRIWGFSPPNMCTTQCLERQNDKRVPCR